VNDENLRGDRWIVAAATGHDIDGGVLQERAAEGTDDEAGDAVTDETEAVFVGRDEFVFTELK
jgi:hypothetical protein